MRILKKIGILLLVLIFVALLAGLLLPKEISLIRSKNLDVAPEQAWNQMNNFKNANAWSPWTKIDPEMTSEIIGNDGEVGSIYKWDSKHKQVGMGEEEVISIDNEKMSQTSEIRFTNPGREGQAEIKKFVTVEDNKTIANWTFNMKAPFPSNVMLLLMGMKSKLSKNFETGLNSLSEICKNMPAEKPSTSFDINVLELPSKNYLGMKKTLKMSELTAYFAKSIPAVFGVATQNNMKILSPPSAIYFTWDPENQQTEMTTAVDVESEDAPEGYELYPIKASKYVVLDYLGSYDKMEGAHHQIEAYIKANGLKQSGNVIEEYHSDPVAEIDTAKWLTKILYSVE